MPTCFPNGLPPHLECWNTEPVMLEIECRHNHRPFFLKFQISCPLDSIQFPLRIISFPLHCFFVPFHFLPISCISTHFLCFPSFLFHLLAILLDFLSISFSYPLFQVFSSFLSIPFISSWFLSISSVPSNFQSGFYSISFRFPLVSFQFPFHFLSVPFIFLFNFSLLLSISFHLISSFQCLFMSSRLI